MKCTAAVRAAAATILLGCPLLADDLFLGGWKLSLAKSRLTGQIIEIQEVPGRGYQFKEDEHTDIIFTDGLDQATHFGDTMAITETKPGTWAITYKRGDQVLMNTVWQVSKDDMTLTYTVTGTRPNGRHFSNRMTAKRIGGKTGLAGTWETTEVSLSSPSEIHIQPFDTAGHRLTYPGRKETVRMNFDGEEYPEDGPFVAAGSTLSGRRVDERTIETTERIAGKVVETARLTISPDGRTQTIVVTEPDDPTPVVLVYDRETAGGRSPASAEETSSAAPAPPREDKRAFGVLPNYRTAEESAPFSPISTKEKFTIAAKDSFDTPVYFTTAFFAGISQLQGSENEIYGQGVKGFAGRLGISYADQVAGNFFPEAIVPVLFHMDPRYFRKGEGSVKSRLGYAVGHIFVSRNDKGQTTFNSPEIVGNAMASVFALSYHVHERTASDVLSQWALTYIATDTVGQVLKEFWPDVKRKYLTKHPPEKP